MFEYLKICWMVLRADRRGVTAVEYAVIAAVLIGVIVTAFTDLGTRLTATMALVLPTGG